MVFGRLILQMPLMNGIMRVRQPVAGLSCPTPQRLPHVLRGWPLKQDPLGIVTIMHGRDGAMKLVSLIPNVKIL